MYCSNCGRMVYEDAIFCSYCGFKLHKEEKEAPISDTSPIIKPDSQVSTVDSEKREVAPVMEPPKKVTEQEVVPVNIMVQPVPDTIEANETPNQPESIEGSDSQSFLQYENQQYLQEEPPMAYEQEKKNIIAFSVLSVIFAVLTIAASVFEMLDDISGIQDIVRLIEISITAIILIVYAFLNNRTVSVLKGIAVFITMVADIIFIGYSSIKYSIESLTSNVTIDRLSMLLGKKEWAIEVFFISMLVWFGLMYIFFVIDTIRSFMGTRKIKIFTLFFGFAAVAAIITNIVFRALIENSVTLYYDIVPMNIVYVFLILAMCFGIIGKKKLKNQEQDKK